MKKTLLFPVVILFALALFAACHKEEDFPPALTLDKEANMTIAELLPTGRCNLKGILVNSSSGPLLYLRSLEDVEVQ